MLSSRGDPLQRSLRIHTSTNSREIGPFEIGTNDGGRAHVCAYVVVGFQLLRCKLVFLLGSLPEISNFGP